MGRKRGRHGRVYFGIVGIARGTSGRQVCLLIGGYMPGGLESMIVDSCTERIRVCSAIPSRGKVNERVVAG